METKKQLIKADDVVKSTDSNSQKTYNKSNAIEFRFQLGVVLINIKTPHCGYFVQHENVLYSITEVKADTVVLTSVASGFVFECSKQSIGYSYLKFVGTYKDKLYSIIHSDFKKIVAYLVTQSGGMSNINKTIDMCLSDIIKPELRGKYTFIKQNINKGEFVVIKSQKILDQIADSSNNVAVVTSIEDDKYIVQGYTQPLNRNQIKKLENDYVKLIKVLSI